MTITRLGPADWHKIEPIVDARRTFQGQAISDEYHALLKEVAIFNRLEKPYDVFHGKWNGDDLVAFTVSRRIMRPGEYCMGLTYTKPGLPKDETGRAGVFVELRNAVVDFFRQEHMKIIWRTRPNVQKWSIERPGVVLSDPTRFTREDVYVVPAGEKCPDPLLVNGLFIGDYCRTEQLISKYTDLNPIPFPEWALNNSSVEHPVPVPQSLPDDFQHPIPVPRSVTDVPHPLSSRPPQ
jgi:hypothetical protein